jgi:hypothetical protein
MKIINFKSKPKNNFFAPEWNYFLAEDFIKDINFNDLTKFLLNKKKQILKLPNTILKNKILDGYTGLGKNSTTARFEKYNVLNWKNENITKLKNNILNFHKNFITFFKLELPKELYIQCWVNIMNKGEKINSHLHSISPDCYLGGHVCIQVNNTSTYYINPINQINEPEIYKSENKIGKITLFQNNIPHYTDEHKFEEKRITIAFDLSLIKFSENYLKII